ncbi:hypothetical protein ACFL4T_14305, partial [candidate division KSB1 bacterium]
MIRFFFVFAVFIFTGAVFTQENKWDIPERYLQGYIKSLKGQVMSYHSPEPGVTSALLVRSIDSNMYIEWETEAVPQDYKSEFVTFLWMFGIDVNSDSHKFDLFVNGKKRFTFSNPKTTDKKIWSVDGDKGAELKFRAVMVDRYEDMMGYATMRLPVSDMKRGEPLIIKVAGETSKSRSWYMTFESKVEQKFSIETEDVMFREGNKLLQSLRFDFVHLGERINGSLSIGKEINRKFDLQPGYNSIQVKIPEVKNPQKYSAEIKIGKRPAVKREFTVHPVKKWKIYFVQHTHTDIGYTRPQSSILPEHLRFIDYALDFCDQTDDFPDD